MKINTQANTACEIYSFPPFPPLWYFFLPLFLQNQISEAASCTRTPTSTRWSPEEQGFLFSCFIGVIIVGFTSRVQFPTTCRRSVKEAPGQNTRTHTHTEREKERVWGSWKTKGSYGDKLFPLFSNYPPFKSPPRLITSRSGMTFGNSWRGSV